MFVYNFSCGAEFDAYWQTVLNKEGLLNALDVLEKPISTQHTYIDLKCWYTAGISRPVVLILVTFSFKWLW